MKNSLTGLRLSTVLLAALLAAHLLLPPLAWIGSAAGFPLNNLFSSEGLRWYYLHIQDGFRAPLTAVVFPLILLVGAAERSGLAKTVRGLMLRGQHSMTYRQRKALAMSCGFLLLYIVCVLLLALGPHAILLSVTGHLYPSPFVAGILVVLANGFILTCLIYAALSFHLRGVQECLSVLYWGLQRHGVWLLVATLAALFFEAVSYVWGVG